MKKPGDEHAAARFRGAPTGTTGRRENTLHWLDMGSRVIIPRLVSKHHA